MTRRVRLRLAALACAAGIAVCAGSAAGADLQVGPQTRTVQDGVYAVAQARRGEALYARACAACHGPALAGGAGPPLAGENFAAVWNKRSLSDLFAKIADTMPADAPATLMRSQVADVVAFMLEANRFPAGGGDLDTREGTLAGITFVSAAPAAPARATAASAPAFAAGGNLNQLMRGVLFPSSNVLFDVQTQDPAARQKGGARADASTTTARYGDVYDPWMVVDAAAVAIADSGPLLMLPGRRCENGKPVPVDRADWQQYVQGLVEAGRAAYRASQTRRQATVSEVTNQISDACANCHRVYRDTPTPASRCTPP